MVDGAIHGRRKKVVRGKIAAGETPDVFRADAPKRQMWSSHCTILLVFYLEQSTRALIEQ